MCIWDPATLQLNWVATGFQEQENEAQSLWRRFFRLAQSDFVSSNKLPCLSSVFPG